MIELPTECPTCVEGYVRPTERKDGHVTCAKCRDKTAEKARVAKRDAAIHRGFK